MSRSAPPPRVRRHGCLLIGHGSRVAGANRVLLRVARRLARQVPGWSVEACFLEAARPGVQDGVDRLVARGAGRILFVPYFLYLGGHVGRDLPREMARARKRHPGLACAAAPHLGFDARLVAIAADRLRLGRSRAGWD